MSHTFVSRFTPSLMTPETLEALLVQRESLVEQIVQGIRRSATTKAKHHVLLVGPRGLGKTHVAAVVYNRVRSEKKLQSRLRIAWLREEERGVTSFLELLVRILTALAREYADAGLGDEIQRLYDLPRRETESAAAARLTQYLGKHTLLLIVENLDAIFAGLKDAGQNAFRAYLQEHPLCTMVATSTSLFSGVSLQKSMFYGFFNITHLSELSVDDAVALLARIAEVRGAAELAEFVRTPAGRARVRAVHHLAGGNHRIYMVFSEFLSRSSLDELVDPFMRMLDDLTPYYQSRLDLLSPQQQQIVELLTHVQGAQTVKEIARRCFITPQTVASQLRDLKEIGYVSSTIPQRDRREAYYELREPLMRLCFEVKEYRGEPIRLFVDFLRHWYSRDELQQRLAHAPPGVGLELACLQRALDLVRDEGIDPRVATCYTDLRKYLAEGESAQVTRVAEEVVGLTGSAREISLWALQLAVAGEEEDGLILSSAALAAEPGSVLGQFFHALTLGINGDGRGAVGILRGAVDHAVAGERLDELVVIGVSLTAAGPAEQLLRIGDRCVTLAPGRHEGWSFRGVALSRLGQPGSALEAIDKAVTLGAREPDLLAERMNCLIQLGHHADALVAAEAIPSPRRDSERVVAGRVLALIMLERSEEADVACSEALRVYPRMALLWAFRGLIQLRLERLEEAFRALSRALEIDRTFMLPYVAKSILVGLEVLKSPRITARARAEWVRRWRELAGEEEEFRTPLAGLAAAVEYLNTGDDRALLALPIEVRRLAVESLEMESGSDGGAGPEE